MEIWNWERLTNWLTDPLTVVSTYASKNVAVHNCYFLMSKNRNKKGGKWKWDGTDWRRRPLFWSADAAFTANPLICHICALQPFIPGDRNHFLRCVPGSIQALSWQNWDTCLSKKFGWALWSSFQGQNNCSKTRPTYLPPSENTLEEVSYIRKELIGLKTFWPEA